VRLGRVPSDGFGGEEGRDGWRKRRRESSGKRKGKKKKLKMKEK
jgi:hypothetical protein